MKASINKATIILPLSHASGATGFFFGKSPKSGMDFSRLNCISTCHHRRYASRTSSALTVAGSDVITTINSLNATVFSCSLFSLRDARWSSRSPDFSHPSLSLRLTQILTGMRVLSGEYGKHRGFETFPASQTRKNPGNINRVPVPIVHGKTIRAQAQYIIRSAVPACLNSVQCPIRLVRYHQIPLPEIEMSRAFTNFFFGNFEGVAGHGMKVYGVMQTAGFATPLLFYHIRGVYYQHPAAFQISRFPI
jgi:hypothetical protein